MRDLVFLVLGLHRPLDLQAALLGKLLLRRLLLLRESTGAASLVLQTRQILKVRTGFIDLLIHNVDLW